MPQNISVLARVVVFYLCSNTCSFKVLVQFVQQSFQFVGFHAYMQQKFQVAVLILHLYRTTFSMRVLLLYKWALKHSSWGLWPVHAVGDSIQGFWCCAYSKLPVFSFGCCGAVKAAKHFRLQFWQQPYRQNIQFGCFCSVYATKHSLGRAEEGCGTVYGSIQYTLFEFIGAVYSIHATKLWFWRWWYCIYIQQNMHIEGDGAVLYIQQNTDMVILVVMEAMLDIMRHSTCTCISL